MRSLASGLSGRWLVLFLRTTGKRTLSKMNAFDLVITVAFGSTFASAILSTDISLLEALSAFALLCGLRYGVALQSVRFQGLIKAQPTLLCYRGAFLEPAMRQEGVTREEVFAAMRGGGFSRRADVDAVVLETDGSFSTVSGASGRGVDALEYVQGAPAEADGHP